MFRGPSALESESEMTEFAEFDVVADEIRRWSSVSEDECQSFVNNTTTYSCSQRNQLYKPLRIIRPFHVRLLGYDDLGLVYHRLCIQYCPPPYLHRQHPKHVGLFRRLKPQE
jgi:hypothetical protein